MKRADVIAWVLSVTAALRLSQSKTLSVLVAAALATARLSLAELGRHLTGPAAAKDRIKRTWRFTTNERIEVATAMRGVVGRLLKRRRKRPLVVGFDWTEVGDFCTLMAAAVMKGRAVPLLWVSIAKAQLKRRRSGDRFHGPGKDAGWRHSRRIGPMPGVSFPRRRVGVASETPAGRRGSC